VKNGPGSAAWKAVMLGILEAELEKMEGILKDYGG